MSIHGLALSSFLRSEEEEPFLLSSGKQSRLYINCREALSHPGFLDSVASFVMQHITNPKDYNYIGGLSFGADPIAIGTTMYCWLHNEITDSGIHLEWFSIRKEDKKHGMKNRIDGAKFKKIGSVILVDDVVTTGNSLREAYNVVTELGMSVDKIITIVERDNGFENLSDIPVPKIAMYKDTDILNYMRKYEI